MRGRKGKQCGEVAWRSSALYFVQFVKSKLGEITHLDALGFYEGAVLRLTGKIPIPIDTKCKNIKGYLQRAQ